MGRPLSRIIVVDDDAAVRQTLNDILTDAGYRVAAFADLGSAYVGIQSIQPHLIIVDLFFPEAQHGADLITSLWSNTATNTIPIIVCSGATEQLLALRPHFERRGVAVIPKPFAIDALLTLVDQILDQPVARNYPPAQQPQTSTSPH